MRHHFRRAVIEGDAKLAFDVLGQPVHVGVVQRDVERLEPPEHGRADPPGSKRPDGHAFHVVGPLHAVGDVPPALDHPLVGGDVVADQRQDHHHHVLRDTDAVGEGDLGDGQAGLAGRLQVVVV